MVIPSLALKLDSWGTFTLVSNVLMLGAAAEFYGRIRKSMGKPVMPIAAFWGGASVAFGICVARLGNVNDLWKSEPEGRLQFTDAMNESTNLGGSDGVATRRTNMVALDAGDVFPGSNESRASSMDGGMCE
ncbi:MAG TPA: hypothetical protein VKP30_33450 [Polyangiaceae bacterium]|nr:hypothetical protein [Polyangiaceae bacterium]